jgi:hypothetical protein
MLGCPLRKETAGLQQALWPSNEDNHAKGGWLFVRKIRRIFNSLNSPKSIPFYYPKLLHPVHGIDKM